MITHQLPLQHTMLHGDHTATYHSPKETIITAAHFKTYMSNHNSRHIQFISRALKEEWTKHQ